MTDWRFYLATLQVIFLPVSRAGAVEVSLTPSNMSWYFEFLEIYVFPFILAASVALLIGYGILRVIGKSSRDEDVFARLKPAHDPDLPVIDVPDSLSSSEQHKDSGLVNGEQTDVNAIEHPVIDVPEEAPAAEPGAELGLAREEQSELSRTLRSAVESAAASPAPMDSESLAERISARATEQEQSGRTRELDDLDADAPVLENSDALVGRIGDRVAEQVMGLAGEASGMPADNAESANKLDALLKRIGGRIAEERAEGEADDAADLAESTNGAGESALPDDGLTPAERLDALLARINAPASDESTPPIDVAAPTSEKSESSEAEQPSSNQLDSFIERIGARAAGESVEDIEVPPVERSTADEEEASTSDRLDELMKRIRTGESEDTGAETAEAVEVSDEPATGSGKEFAAEEPAEAEAAAMESAEDFEPVAPVISDEELPDLDFEIDADTAMDDVYAQRVEPTFAPTEDMQSQPPAEPPPEELTEPEIEVPVDLVPEGPVESVMDMALDVDGDSFGDEMPITAGESGADAVVPADRDEEISEAASVAPPFDATAEQAFEEEPFSKEEELSFEEQPSFEEEPEDTVVEPDAGFFEDSAAIPIAGEGDVLRDSPETDAAAPADTRSAEEIDELVRRIGSRVPEEFGTEEVDVDGPSGPGAELLTRISARVSDEADRTPAETIEAVEVAESEAESVAEPDVDGRDGDDADIEKPVLERLIDRDRKQVDDERAAAETAVPDAVEFSQDELLRDHGEVGPEPTAVSASLNGPDDASASPAVDAEVVPEPGPPARELPEPETSEAAVEAVPASAAANGLAGQIVSDLDAASVALERVSRIVEGYETAREGLDLEALGGMRISGVSLPQDAESTLQRFGDDISGAAISGFATIDSFNHMIDQLSEMAQEEPLDEGWNELLQDRIQETIAAVGGVCRRMREVAPDRSSTGDDAPGGPGHAHDDPRSAGLSAGGE